LIGDGQIQRKRILDDFERIYDVRSRIVHRGKSRLTGGERGLFNTLHWICRRVIQKEVDLLLEDVDEARKETRNRIIEGILKRSLSAKKSAEA